MAGCARRTRACDIAIACSWLAWPACWVQHRVWHLQRIPVERCQNRRCLASSAFRARVPEAIVGHERPEEMLFTLRQAWQEGREEEDAKEALRDLFPGGESLDENQIYQLLQVRELAKQGKQYVLAELLLGHAKPYLENQGLTVEDIRPDDSTKAYRLVPHPRIVAAERAAALAEGTQARSIARQALQQSLLADSDEAASHIAAAAAAAVWQRLRSEAARKQRALPGRQAADLAMVLALVGCADQTLFNELASITTKEIERTSGKSALITMQQIVEKCAAAGYRQCDYPALFAAGLEALQKLKCPNTSSLVDLRTGNYTLHSQRPMLWLFRHARRQGRKSIPPADAAARFAKAIRGLNAGSSGSLVVDLGCGFGVSSLGLALSGFSALAADASAHCIGFARALSKRWRLPPQELAFVHGDAQEALQSVSAQYRGEVSWVLINFPTPFASLDANSANLGWSTDSELC